MSSLSAFFADPQHSAKIKSLFQSFDTDNNGFLERDELRRLGVSIAKMRFEQATGSEKPATDASGNALDAREGAVFSSLVTQAVDAVLDRLDTNHDHRLSYDEFSANIDVIATQIIPTLQMDQGQETTYEYCVQQ
mmetsp:Transcript_8182/g.26133  ORF Transcript_8182/g.26133 Transcript_8182/m.26133 type:complete len:135 (+) Transcript_8182:84-488(+)